MYFEEPSDSSPPFSRNAAMLRPIEQIRFAVCVHAEFPNFGCPCQKASVSWSNFLFLVLFLNERDSPHSTRVTCTPNFDLALLFAG